MRPRTLRARLLLAFLLTLAIAVVSGPVVTGLAIRDYLDDQARARLASTVTRIGGALSGREDVRVPASGLVTVLPAQSTIVAIGPDGTVVGRLGADDLADTTDAELATDAATLDPGDVGQFGARSAPYLLTRVATNGLSLAGDEADGTADHPVAELLVAVDITADRLVFRRIVAVSVAAGAMALVVLGAAATLLLRRALAPLRRIAVSAAGPPPRDLTGAARGGGREVETLAESLHEAFVARDAAEDRLRTFVADASHELRTPLTAMAGWLDLYVQGALDGDSLEEALQRVSAETARMRLLVDELGLLARLDAHPGLDLTRETLDLAALARDVVEDSAVVWPDTPFTVEAPAAVPVQGDPARLRQVLGNLVGNAVQHNPPGTTVTVGVQTGAHGATAVSLVVVDTGAGIAAEDLPKVFDRFYRTDASRGRARGGSGLGLAIVAGIVAAHGGCVRAESVPGRGTTVEVTLPGTVS